MGRSRGTLARNGEKRLGLARPGRHRASTLLYCCWWRLTHPARVTSSTCKGEKSALIGRSYPDRGASKGPAEFSDTTGVGLYAGSQIIGGLGVSGDTACAGL